LSSPAPRERPPLASAVFSFSAKRTARFSVRSYLPTEVSCIDAKSWDRHCSR
jgi:hypothetical protein